MGIITVIGSTKGGAGKSTTLCQLASMRALAGKKVCIFDLDQQRSAYNFAHARSAADISPPIRAFSSYLDIRPGADPVPLGRALIKDIRETAESYDDVLIDVGGFDNPGLRFAMNCAHQMVVPLAPAQFDIWSLADLSKILSDIASSRTDEFRPIIMPCMVSPQTTERDAFDTIKTAYSVFDYAPGGVLLSMRVAFRKQLGEGLGVFDSPKPDSKARQELLGVYRLVFKEDWSRHV